MTKDIRDRIKMLKKERREKVKYIVSWAYSYQFLTGSFRQSVDDAASEVERIDAEIAQLQGG